jgi:homoserine dehydrogenase
MQRQNKISKFLDFLYTATISAGIPIIQSANSAKEFDPYL